MTMSALSGPAAQTLAVADQEKLDRCLKGFAPWDEDVSPFGSALGVSIGWGEPFEPWVLRFMLVDVVGCDDFGRGEKVAWVCTVEMDGTPIQFSFRRFGLRAAVDGRMERAEAASTVATCLRRLRSALPLVEKKLIRPLIDQAIDDGQVTISNQYPYFKGMYEHLRGLAEQSSIDAAGLKPVSTAFPHGASMSFPAVTRAREAEFEAHGALLALFSMLEHVLVIAMSFDEFDASAEKLSAFLRFTWSEKFKRVVDITDPDGKAVYDLLKRLADENRNPAAHGGIDRRATNLAVHLPGYGAVPQGVFPGASAPTYSFHPGLPRNAFPFTELLDHDNSASGWPAVDHVIAWLEQGQLAAPCTYGESGLPLLFDPASRAEAHAAQAPDGLDELLDRRSRLVDQAANMDW